MNRHSRSFAVALVLTLAIIGCASTPDRIAFTSINGAVDGVQTALKVWNETSYAPGVKVDPIAWNAKRDRVESAYVKFQASAQLATTLAKDITQRANATKVASDAAAEVIALIQALTGGK